MMNAAQVVSPRQYSNFDFLRFVSACLVIISHSCSLTGKEEQEALYVWTNSYHFSSLALICFLTISGYLVYQSLDSSRSLLSYAWKRILRIVPALFFVCLVSVFILGPLVTDLPAATYFKNLSTYSYLKNILVINSMQWDLPGVFLSNPETGVNGSLWTLTLEGRLYIALAVLYLFSVFTFRKIVLILFLLLASFAYFGIYKLNIPEARIVFPLYFMAGVVAALYKKEMIYNKWLALTSILIIVAYCFSHLLYPLLFLAFPYLILYLAQLPSRFNHFSRYGDFSYGMYLFSFPVQQCIVHFANRNISVSLMICLSLLLTLPFAILSWKLVESKALQYKNRIRLAAH